MCAHAFNKEGEGMQGRISARRAVATVLVFALLAISVVVLCASGGSSDRRKTRSDGSLTINVEHVSEGYIQARGTATSKRLKLRVKKGEEVLTYDLNGDGEYETFPLQYGSGSYTCTLYQNTSGSRYSQEGRITVKATLEDENAPFLCPNQYVNYASDTELEAEVQTLCASLTTAREKYDAICKYVTTQFGFDYIAAVTNKPGQLPDVEKCFSRRMGVCQDLSAVTVSMLRVAGVPAKLVIGYADENYHAWVTAEVDGEEVLFDPTAELQGISRPKSYTVERFY